MSPTNHQIHEAGRHLAVAEALLKGHSASLEGVRTYISINGHMAQVQVARQGTWMIDNVDKYLAGTTDKVVLIDITGERAAFYVLPGDDVRALVRQEYEKFMARLGGARPRNPDSKQTRIDPADVHAWRDAWTLFD